MTPHVRSAFQILLVACLTALCASAAPTRKKVIVGINRDYPPYEYLDLQGRAAGYDVDLLRAVAEVEDLELEFKADSWDATLTAFREGRLDMLAGMLHSKTREAVADFSTPHMVVHYTLFVRRGDRRIQGEADLPGRTVLVERQSQMHDYFSATGMGVRALAVASEPETLRRLALGEGDAAAVPQLLGMVIAKQAHLAIQPAGGPLFTRQLCFVTQMGDGDLLSRLNTGLAILNQTGRYAEIYPSWFGRL